MGTQCTPAPLQFYALGRRQVIGRFDGGRITSDAGGVLHTNNPLRSLTLRGARLLVSKARQESEISPLWEGHNLAGMPRHASCRSGSIHVHGTGGTGIQDRAIVVY